MAYIIGIDIGGTTTAGGLVDSSGKVRHYHELRTPARSGSEAILATAAEVATEVRRRAQAAGQGVDACGIGVPGIVEWPRGRVRYSGALSQWTGTEVAQSIGERLRLNVRADNDVNVLALAERRFGAGRGFDDVLYVAVGTGVGGALVLGGNLWRGATGAAGEIGMLQTDDGDLDSRASGPAIAARYCRLTGEREALSMLVVAERARRGDTHAVAVMREGAVALGKALNGLLNVLDPQALIIGGGVSRNGDLWWGPLRETINANLMPGPAGIRVLPAALYTHRSIVGAASLWME